MVKVEAIIDFLYSKFDKVKNLVRKDKEQDGKIFKGDTFEVDKKEAEYLLGNNAKSLIAVKVLEEIEILSNSISIIADSIKIDGIEEEIKPKKRNKKKKEE